MADLPLGQLWSWLFQQHAPEQKPNLYEGLMKSRSPGVNPALLDSNLHAYDPSQGGPRFDRYREDEPGVQEWYRKYGSRLDEGGATAPAAPPQILNGGASADPRGEVPDPMWMREYARAKNLDIGRI